MVFETIQKPPFICIQPWQRPYADCSTRDDKTPDAEKPSLKRAAVFSCWEGVDMELSEKDMHCLARIIQGDLYENNKLFCCRGYCKYSGECNEDVQNQRKFQYNLLREHLEAATGVYLGYLANPEYVYQRMMKDSWFEAEGIDPFRHHPEMNSPKWAMDWIHAKGVKEKAIRFRSMIRIKKREVAWFMKSTAIYWGSFVKCTIHMLIYQLRKRIGG